MILTAIGAAASAPNPPPCTITPTAIFGSLAGAKQVNTASFSPELLMPFCAVPVFPAISTPATEELAVANAVPSGFWVTWIIIAVISLATDALTGVDSTDGVVLLIVVRSGACTDSSRYGRISTPLLAIAAASIASCSGVTVSLYCPIAVMPVSDASGTVLRLLGDTGIGIVRLASFQPNFVA